MLRCDALNALDDCLRPVQASPFDEHMGAQHLKNYMAVINDAIADFTELPVGLAVELSQCHQLRIDHSPAVERAAHRHL